MRAAIAFLLGIMCTSAGAQYFQGDPTRATCFRQHPDYNLCELDRIASLLRIQNIQFSAEQPIKEHQQFWCDQSRRGYPNCMRAVRIYDDSIARSIALRNGRTVNAAQREQQRQRDEERLRETLRQIREGKL